MAFITGNRLLHALRMQGLIDDTVKRVVIDIPVDDAITLYTERIGDVRLLAVVTALDGVEITRKDSEE